MKKRLLSMLLILCLVTTLLSGFSVTASADNDTIQHTIKRGETVIGICNTLGIDFYANYKWITETNKITNYGNLKEGMVLTLPKPGTTPSVVPGGKPEDKPTTPAPNPGGTVLPGNNGLKLLGNDFVSGYLISHIMQRGETISGVCSSLGINFTQNQATIQKLNNIQSYNKIYAGRAILLPSANPPASGSVIAVVAHKVVSGDAMYNVCQNYGIDYAANLKMIQNMNGRNDNFANIKVGQVIYLPVPTVVNAGGNPSPSPNPGGGGGGTVKPSNPDGDTTPDSKSYKITALTTNHGSYTVSVGGKTYNPGQNIEAKAGSTVSVKASPAWNHQLGYISVTSGSKNINVNNGQFVMPSGAVKITVKFVSEAEHTVLRDKTENGKFACYVNGQAVDKAPAGQVVQVLADANYGFELDKVMVVKEGNIGVDFNYATNTFIMPNEQVTVKVTFKAGAVHPITSNPVSGAGSSSYSVKINGNNVNEAKSGETVKIVTYPDKANGYKVSSITVTDNNTGARIAVNGGSFIMPANPVTVDVKFSKSSYNITIKQPANGKLSVDKTSAEFGETVTVTLTPNGTAEGGRYFVNGVEQSSNSFTMPAQDVVVSAEFTNKLYSISIAPIKYGTLSISKTQASAGDKVSISVYPNGNAKLESISVTNAEVTKLNEGTYEFTMPGHDVTISATFVSAAKYKINCEAVENGAVEAYDAAWALITESESGKTVNVYANPNMGYQVSEIKVNGTVISGTTFTMPQSDVTITVTFVEIP